MSSLIQFLEAARTVWRGVLLVVACAGIYGAYQYQHQQDDIFSRHGLASAVRSVRSKTNIKAFNSALERFEKVLEREDGIGGTVRIAAGDSGGTSTETSSPGAPASRKSAATRTQSARAQVSNGGDAALRGDIPRVAAVADVGDPDRGTSSTVEAKGPEVRLTFRRFASQFCRATRSLALYYSDHVAGSNGSATRVGSGVGFPSIERLTAGNDRSIAEKELEVRLRCDYELAYGAGERADPNRPQFEQWREATLERRYGEMWTRIDLTRIPTPDDPMSRGEWYVVTPPSQE